MPPMGEAVEKLLATRGEEIKARVEKIKTSPAGKQIAADLQAVSDAIDTLVKDVRVGIDDALGQANPASAP